MTKIYVGIDVSYQSFDASLSLDTQQFLHGKFSNNVVGFSSFLSWLSDLGTYDWQIVIEATGIYHSSLTLYCFEKSYTVFVVNALSVRRYGQSLFWRAKTDSSDAKLISLYGKTYASLLRVWEASESYLVVLKQAYQVREQFLKQRTALTNQLHAYSLSPENNDLVLKVLRTQISALDKNIAIIEQEIEAQIQAEEGELLELLLSIPGIGQKNAFFLIILTEGFRKFDNPKSLSAYIGLAPRVFESGTSVKGKGHICKMGTKEARKLLYMAARSAARYNESCKIFYERLRKKGKSYKVAIIAVANKLLKQVFAVVRKKTLFDKEYHLQKNK